MSPPNITLVNDTQWFSCGKNGVASNASYYKMSDAYLCGVYQGSYKTLIGHKFNVSKVLTLAVFTLLSQLTHAMSADVSAIVLGQQQIVPYNLTYVYLPHDNGVASIMETMSLGDILVNTATRSSFEILPESNNTINKRHMRACINYKQVQIAESGIWWSAWYRIGSCVYTYYSDGGAEYSIEWGYTYTWSIEAGPITWGHISGLIGAQWQESVSKSSTLTCLIPAKSSGSVWYQTQVLWGNAQYRDVSSCFGAMSAWSRYYHFDAPSKFDLDSGTVQLGCSTGEASGCN